MKIQSLPVLYVSSCAVCKLSICLSNKTQYKNLVRKEKNPEEEKRNKVHMKGKNMLETTIELVLSPSFASAAKLEAKEVT